MKCDKCGIDCSNHYGEIGLKIILCASCYKEYLAGQHKIPINMKSYDDYRKEFKK